MMTPPLPYRLLLFVLLVTGCWGSSQAEPIYPLLSPAAVVRLRAQLHQSRPDTHRVKLLLQLSNHLLSSFNELGTDLDSVAAYAQQAQRLSNQLHFGAGRMGSLYVLGQWRLAQADTLGRPLLRQGIQLSRARGDRTAEALGWYYLAESYPLGPDNAYRKLANYQRSRAIYQQLGARREATYLLKSIADAHLQQGDLARCISELTQVLASYRALGGHQPLHYTYNLLHAAHERAGNYKEALRCQLAAIESAQASRDTVSISGFYSDVANLYNDLGQQEMALKFQRKALVNAQQTMAVSTGILAAGRISQLFLAWDQPQRALRQFLTDTKPFRITESDSLTYIYFLTDCYVEMGRYQLAERGLVRYWSVPARRSDALATHLMHQQFGKLYYHTKQYDKCRWHLQQVLHRMEQSGTTAALELSRVHLLLFGVDSAQGRFPAAIAHYQRYKALTDSIFNEKKNKQLASLQIQYDTHKKEQNIALLTKTNQVQQARIRQREFQRNAGLAGAALLALLLGLGYNRYRLKQRATRLLEAQQQEINRKNASLEQLVGEKQNLLEEKEDLLQEKDWMLKEIHHRVKNNLQVISSLLNTQADYLRDPAALAALRESQNRVQAMALVHQQLYQSDSVALVNMQAYIQEITERLLESFDCFDRVREQLDVAHLELDVALATPLGLIINESITNALKHAFPQGRAGTLSICLQPLESQRYELLIADDGVGLPPGFDPARSQSLGLTMIKGLSKQLNGVLHLSQGPGMQLRLQFAVARQHAPAAAFA
jgi:two-component sensor histidine kinase